MNRKPSHQQLAAPTSTIESHKSDCQPILNKENKQSGQESEVLSKLSTIKLTHKLKRRQQIILNAAAEPDSEPSDRQSQCSNTSSLCAEIEQTSLKFLQKKDSGKTVEEHSQTIPDVTISDIRKNPNGQLLSTDSNEEEMSPSEAQLWIRFENSGSSQFKQTNTEDWDIELSRTV